MKTITLWHTLSCDVRRAAEVFEELLPGSPHTQPMHGTTDEAMPLRRRRRYVVAGYLRKGEVGIFERGVKEEPTTPRGSVQEVLKVAQKKVAKKAVKKAPAKKAPAKKAPAKKAAKKAPAKKAVKKAPAKKAVKKASPAASA